MKAEPYLLLDGVEIANSMRTLTYLRKGLGGGFYDVPLAHPLRVAEGPGYGDVYEDVYVGDAYKAENLVNWCATMDHGPYSRPAYDPAPWYDSARPESADFLGLWADVEILSAGQRIVTARASGGGNLSPVTVSPRIVQVTAKMFAASRSAMSYGQRWLARALLGSDDSCLGSTLTVLPSCGDDDDLREIAGAGLVTAPIWSPITDIPACVMQEVSFQMAGADGYLRAATPLGSQFAAIGDVFPPLAATMRPRWATADAGLLLRVTATGTVDGLGISASSTIGGPADLGALTVVDLLEDEVLIVDSSLEQAYVEGGETSRGGLDAVDFDGVFPWIVAAAGGAAYINVGATGPVPVGTRVELIQVDREV